MISISTFYIFLTPLILASILVPFVARLSVRIGGIDTPNERKVHIHATPRLGGIAIFTSMLFTIIFFCDINQQIKGFLAGAIVVFLTGLADDLANLTPRQKFVGEFVAAGLAVFLGGITVRNLGNPFGMGIIELGPVAIPFTLIAIVGLINAVNLMDGLDGLAGGVCAIASVSFAVISYNSGNSTLFPLTIALLGALLGFLRYNNYPARIFMGDGGSLLLGYCMGVFSVLLACNGTSPVSPYIPLLILGVPILDTLVVMVKRKWAGKRLFQPDKTHLHHRLLDVGIGHKYTVLIVYSFSYLLNIIAMIGCNLNRAGTCNLNDTYLLLMMISVSASIYGALHFIRSRRLDSINFFNTQLLRSLGSYRSLVRISAFLVSGIKVLLIAILMLPAFLSHKDFDSFLFVPIVMLIISVMMTMLRHRWVDQLLQGYIYSFTFLLIYAMENYGRDDAVLGVPLLYVSHGVFFLLLLIEGIKIFIRNRSLLLISSPFEYLIMFIVLSTLLLPHALTDKFYLMTVVAKSVIMFVGFKLILMRKIDGNYWIVHVIMFSILVLVGRYLIGV